MSFIGKPNIIYVKDNIWADLIRPELMKMSEYRPQNDDEDINDMVLYYTDPDTEERYAILPKFFWHLLYRKLSPKIPNIDNYVVLPQILPENKVSLKFNEEFQPKEHQIPIINKALDEYEKNKHLRVTIKASTGFGKTFSALYIAHKLGLKTLIICHNETLFKQWHESILKFYNIEEDQIGRIQGSDLKKVKKEASKDIVLVKSQSLMSQTTRCDLEELYDIYSQFSLLIQDEVHTTGGALKFARSAAIIPTPNILSLSATPRRKGINKLIMEAAIGTNIIESKHMNMVPEVFVHVININLDSVAKSSMARYPQYVQKLATLNKFLTNNINYLNIIVDQIVKCVQEGHRVLTIAANNTMVRKLVTLLEAKNVNAVEFTAQKRHIPDDVEVVVSNNQLSSTGMDLPFLSCLVLANHNISRTLLVQSAGRVLRVLPGKKDPVVHIFFEKSFIDLINRGAVHAVKNNMTSEYGSGLKFHIDERGVQNA